MRLNINLFLLALLVILCILVFRNWFGAGLIAGGDFQAYYSEMFPYMFFFPPPAWLYTLGNGLGVNGTLVSWNYLSVEMPVGLFGLLLGFDWPIVERLGYLFPYLILSFTVPYYVFRKLLGESVAFLSVLIFGFNTYILMLLGGGQIFLALSYILMPLVFYSFFRLVQERILKTKIRYTLLTALVFSLQTLMDLRIAYVTLVLISFYYFLSTLFFNKALRNIIYFIPILFITFLLHAFWIIPTFLIPGDHLGALGTEFTSTEIVKFLSFAKLENTISLLQPNWPENIFGKEYFMRAEFIVLPVLAFSSLLFLKKEKKAIRELVLFFVLVALLGAFLAKGADEPFGSLYLWMFNYIPGFVMFRDSTKWYPLVAVSYSMLIPYTVLKFYDLLGSHKKFSVFSFQFSNKTKIFNLQNLFIILTTLYLLLLIAPAWLGQLSGVFKSTSIPYEYVKLKDFLSKDKNYYRTFWVPYSSTYSFYSPFHPIILGRSFVATEGGYKSVSSYLRNKDSEDAFKNASVKYVIIPWDTDSKIFLKDRKYDEKQYLKTVKEVKALHYLKEVTGFGKIKLFETSSYNDHFSSPSKKLKIKYEFITPAKYRVILESATKGDVIIFAEAYDKLWRAKGDNFLINSMPKKLSSSSKNKINSFRLPRGGSYTLEIYYSPQKLVDIGTIVSGAGMVSVLLILAWLIKKK